MILFNQKVRFNAPIGTTRYTIVVAQIEKSKSMDFTLKCYCMSKVTLTEVPKKYSNVKQVCVVIHKCIVSYSDRLYDLTYAFQILLDFWSMDKLYSWWKCR